MLCEDCADFQKGCLRGHRFQSSLRPRLHRVRGKGNDDAEVLQMNDQEILIEAAKTAEAHWKFLEKWLHMIYVDSFIHGYKHAIEDKELQEIPEAKP
jgi:hypothetical protein